MTVFDRLAAICGRRYVRSAGLADAVGGAAPRWVAAPGDPDEVSGLVTVAADETLAIAARGTGTKIDWGTPPSRLDVLVDLRRLSGVRQRVPGQGTVTVGAGTPVRTLQSVLAGSRVRVGLDPGAPGATVGGSIAADEAGPLRLRHGSIRDQLTGLEFVRADGLVVRSAGRTVADSFGYDPAALLPGSLGSLGLITAATLRLHDVPAARRWVLRPVRSPYEVRELTALVLGAGLDPAAVEMELPPSDVGTLAVLFEGSPDEVAVRVRATITLLGAGAAADDEPPGWWGRYPFRPGGVAMKLVAPVAALHAIVYALRDGAGAPVPVRGSPAIGEAWAALPADLPLARVEAAITATRTAVEGRGGAFTVLTAPTQVRAAVDLSAEGPDLSRARRAKARFDPEGTLVPGRLPLAR